MFRVERYVTTIALIWILGGLLVHRFIDEKAWRDLDPQAASSPSVPAFPLLTCVHRIVLCAHVQITNPLSLFHTHSRGS